MCFSSMANSVVSAGYVLYISDCLALRSPKLNTLLQGWFDTLQLSDV